VVQEKTTPHWRANLGITEILAESDLLKVKLSEIEDIDRLGTKDDLRTGLESLENRLERRIAQLEPSVLKWMIGMQVGTVSVILGALYFILPHWKP
jgi:hypothetical protein